MRSDELTKPAWAKSFSPLTCKKTFTAQKPICSGQMAWENFNVQHCTVLSDIWRLENRLSNFHPNLLAKKPKSRAESQATGPEVEKLKCERIPGLPKTSSRLLQLPRLSPQIPRSPPSGICVRSGRAGVDELITCNLTFSRATTDRVQRADLCRHGCKQTAVCDQYSNTDDCD